MILTVDNYQFDFKEAVSAYKFDDANIGSIRYHGMSNKLSAVDVVAEFPDRYLFVEIKDYKGRRPGCDCPDVSPGEGIKWLRDNLRKKYIDSFCYRYAEDKADKPIYYICLIETADSALVSQLKKNLREVLPIGLECSRWRHEILRNVTAVNVESWNRCLGETYGLCRKAGPNP